MESINGFMHGTDCAFYSIYQVQVQVGRQNLISCTHDQYDIVDHTDLFPSCLPKHDISSTDLAEGKEELHPSV